MMNGFLWIGKVQNLQCLRSNTAIPLHSLAGDALKLARGTDDERCHAESVSMPNTACRQDVVIYST